MKPIIVFFVIIAVILIIVAWYVLTYNKFIKLRNHVEEAFSTMDVYMKKRYDLIPNLVETVKGYAAHEKETLDAVITARAHAVSSNDISGKIQAENELTSTLSKLLAISENYPDLKANTNFIDLQQSLKTIEDEIANARKYYNAVVKNFNIMIESIPSNIVAKLAKFNKAELFEIAESERANVQVKF